MIKGVNVCIIYEDKVLTGERMPGPTWGGKLQFPGGRIEEGESSLHAAQREVLEECGLLLEADNLYPMGWSKSRWPHGGYFGCMGYYYPATKREVLAIRNMEPLKNLQWVWLQPIYAHLYRTPCAKLLSAVRKNPHAHLP